MAAPYAIRANYINRFYAVYDTRTGKDVAVYSYEPCESDRGIAHGFANLKRNQLNKESSNVRHS